MRRRVALLAGLIMLAGLCLLVGVVACSSDSADATRAPRPLCEMRTERCNPVRTFLTTILPRRIFSSASGPVVGEVLNTTNGTWTNTPAGFAYQWQRCAPGCSNIPGAVANSYTITSSDLGDTIKVIVTASNPGGATAATSAATGVVTSGVTCNLYASTTGSDGAAGTVNAPFLTVNKLETSLSAGQTGCLNPGSYGSITSASAMILGTSGSAGLPITITSLDPSNPAQLLGWVSIRGNFITLQDVNIDGANEAYVGPNQCGSSNISESMEIEGNDDILQYIDYHQSTRLGDGIGIGFPGAGHGDRTIIRFSALHDVGACQGFDHLVYMSHGANMQIYDNWMWNDAHGFGVQVYPCPTSGSIHSNVIDKAASGFVVESDGGCTVSNNTITNNVVSNSVGNASIGSTGQGILTCCAASLSGNTFTVNDVFNNPAGIGSGATGLTVSSNITSNPLFVDAAAHNYALQAGSPAAGYGLPAAVGPLAGP